MKDKKVIVIGGGPAGIMAAIAASKSSSQVILAEKNKEIAQKLKITGGGRCNVTNNASLEKFMDKIVTNNKFLYKSLNLFTNKQLMQLIEENGCTLKIEEEGKVFPKSDKSSDIIKVFDKLLKKNNVKIYYQCHIKDILVKNKQVVGVQTWDNLELKCDSVVVATGGVSYPHTGSSGEGFLICQKLGHTIIPLKPSLTSMVIKEKWLTSLMGITLKNILIKTKIKNQSISFYGDLLFTHYGISGPAVFELSAYINKIPLSKEGHSIFIDLLPEEPQEKLRELISNNKSNKKISSILIEYLPKKLVYLLLEHLNIQKDISLCQLSKKDANKIIQEIKYFHIRIEELRSIKYAIVTSGGISVKEVNPSTMESKLIKGLYFAGEILDVDALTGGYNLQIAFSTGYVAGVHSSK